LEDFVFRHRAIVLGSSLALSLSFLVNLPGAAIAADAATTLNAYVDGKPIPLGDVSKYYCDDLSYPDIECSRTPLAITTRATLATLLTSVDYVTIWDLPGYSGTFMNISQDYTMLSLIGWNDRISSFKVRNGETGTFFVDWFYNGSQWSFCCNTQQPSLGGYDNSFSSVQRT
jgi:hypothetical protein